MPALLEMQQAFLRCLYDGPEYFPEDAFAQSPDRALLAMRAYANTVSHARLVALEESFPLTREHIGSEIFNRISRDFIETPDARAASLNDIGYAFPDFLSATTMDRQGHDLCQIEWAWLESYRSAEAPPLSLTDFSGLAQDDVLTTAIALHPSVRFIPLSAELPASLGCQSTNAAMLMIARPHAAVLLYPLPSETAQIANKIASSKILGNLLGHAIECAGEDAAMTHIVTLIEAGAITKAKDPA